MARMARTTPSLVVCYSTSAIRAKRGMRTGCTTVWCEAIAPAADARGTAAESLTATATTDQERVRYFCDCSGGLQRRASGDSPVAARSRAPVCQKLETRLIRLGKRAEPEGVRLVDGIAIGIPIQVEPPRQSNRVFLRRKSPSSKLPAPIRWLAMY